jgi:hypothetical protein
MLGGDAAAGLMPGQGCGVALLQYLSVYVITHFNSALPPCCAVTRCMLGGDAAAGLMPGQGCGVALLFTVDMCHKSY